MLQRWTIEDERAFRPATTPETFCTVLRDAVTVVMSAQVEAAAASRQTIETAWLAARFRWPFLAVCIETRSFNDVELSYPIVNAAGATAWARRSIIWEDLPAGQVRPAVLSGPAIPPDAQPPAFLHVSQLGQRIELVCASPRSARLIPAACTLSTF